ncbi:tripartite tricarboxylate transporter substrate binding protein [Oceanicella actignis]|uniref:tripartite tricarboxylate transporter substrate binding protein n=1 Tax=Oceanicella actignis TaxID=1189325 RepID=UPI0011E6BA0D|nr:tripartite tricarboxylate transporter substrate binding protein [Oceanicella actignis]TYO85357.1 tripartite-type tricarboxylate transporter receptor subunit TctC [Oceanicella actignis]
MKRMLAGALALALTATAAVAEYPEKEIQGIIQWGAGGSTDTVMRSVTPHAEKVLGGVIVLQNMTGAVGAIALNYVAGQPADGYTLLMGAENPMLYKVMGLGDKDYGEFIPISILARGTAVLVARPDTPFDDYAEMISYVKAHPGEVKFGSTGPGGVPSVINAMIGAVEGELEVTRVPYDGDGPALTALQGGAIDVMPAVLGAAIEPIRAGKMKVLAIMDSQPNAKLPDAPYVTQFNAGYETYLPWGPFFGVFVRKGTPDEAVRKLTEAYAKGAQHPDFVKLMNDRGFTLMGISGKEAEDFLAKWQQGTAWLLHDAGLTKASPEEFGIARPGN